MKIQKIVIVVLALVMCSVMLCGCAIFQREGRTRTKVLMVTGNFFDSRLICDLAQYKTKQPILVVSPDESGSYQIFYVPSNEEHTAQIALEDLGDFISFLNPRNTVIMGGPKFIPQEVIDVINTKTNNVIQFTNEDWEKNAVSLGRMMKQDRLPRDYREYVNKFQSAEN